MVLRNALLAVLGPSVRRQAGALVRPLGLRLGTRISWTCVGCNARLTAPLGAAPACPCGGIVRPTTTS